MARRAMTNEEWADVARAIAHLCWDSEDEEGHDYYWAIAERCYEGTLTEEERADLAEQHEEWAEHYEDEEWYDLFV